MSTVHYERVIEDLIANKLENAIKEFLDWRFEEKVNTMIDETIKGYDFSDYLDDWVDEYLNEHVKDKIDSLIVDKIEGYLGCISPEDYDYECK